VSVEELICSQEDAAGSHKSPRKIERQTGISRSSEKFENVEQLKQAIVMEWRALSQRFIDGSINQWRRHLQGVIQENDGHIEHKFSCRHLYSALLFVADVIRDELFAGVQHMIFSKLSVCDSRVDRMWRHLAC